MTNQYQNIKNEITNYIQANQNQPTFELSDSMDFPKFNYAVIEVTGNFIIVDVDTFAKELSNDDDFLEYYQPNPDLTNNPDQIIDIINDFTNGNSLNQYNGVELMDIQTD